MVPTFLIDSPTAMIIGSVCAILGRRDERSRSRWWILGLLAVSVFLGTALAVNAVGPDWMWMYFIEPPDLSVFDLAFIAIIIYYVPYIAGFALTCGLDRLWGRSGTYVALASFVILNVFVMNRLWDRYYHVGTREQYLSGTAVRLTGEHDLKTVLNIGGAALAATAIVLISLAVFEARRVRAPRNQ